MIYILFNGHYYSEFKVKAFDLIYFSNLFECHDEILVLQKPRLITESVDYLDNRSSKMSLNVLNDVKVHVTNKFDKKYKSSSQDNDSTQSRRYKNRSIKSKRKNSEELSDVKILSRTSDVLFTQESLDKPNPKSRKVKRRQKSTLIAYDSQSAVRNNLIEKVNGDFTDNPGLDKNFIISQPMTVHELSRKVNIPETEIITYLFLNEGITLTINELLDVDILSKIAKNYGFNLVEDSFDNCSPVSVDNILENTVNSVQRPPIIAVLGHVDHGKTTLLDSILKTHLATKENGGITQAISGYNITFNHNFKDYKLVFLDTPGHESFKSMRLRGARITDIILLVIAIDDGVKPQTLEAIQYIKQMNLSCIIVITKADKLSDNLDKIKQDLCKEQLICKDLGGSIDLIEVSAMSGKNIDKLLSLICVLSENKKLLANPANLAFGTIIESYLDKKKGPVANVIVHDGTLKVADKVVADNFYCKIKSIIDKSGKRVSSIGPSSIAQVLGFTKVPLAGSTFSVCKNEKQAKQMSLEHSGTHSFDALTKFLNTRITSQGKSTTNQLNLIIKTDTQGSFEAILDLLLNISQSKVQINIINSNSCFGVISTNDIDLAVTTNSSILGFNVNMTSQITNLLKKSKIDFRNFNVIYDLFEYVQELMLSLVELEYDYILVGTATVKTIFKMNRGFVAGCLVDTGKLNKNCYIHVKRNSSIVYQGFIISLKQIKNDVTEVVAFNECGLMANFTLWQQFDRIEAYEVVAKEKTL